MIVTLVVVAALILGCSFVVQKSGILYPAVVRVKDLKKYRVAYTPVVGPYSKAYSHVHGIEEYLKEKTGYDYQMQPCFGIYYDNPAEVPGPECRASMGKILRDGDKIEANKELNIEIAEIELGENMVVEFPIPSKPALFIAMHRAYRALEKKIESEGRKWYPTVELYGIPDGGASFAVPTGTRGGIMSDFPKKTKND